MSRSTRSGVGFRLLRNRRRRASTTTAETSSDPCGGLGRAIGAAKQKPLLARSLTSRPFSSSRRCANLSMQLSTSLKDPGLRHRSMHMQDSRGTLSSGMLHGKLLGLISCIRYFTVITGEPHIHSRMEARADFRTVPISEIVVQVASSRCRTASAHLLGL